MVPTIRRKVVGSCFIALCRVPSSGTPICQRRLRGSLTKPAGALGSALGANGEVPVLGPKKLGWCVSSKTGREEGNEAATAAPTEADCWVRCDRDRTKAGCAWNVLLKQCVTYRYIQSNAVDMGYSEYGRHHFSRIDYLQWQCRLRTPSKLGCQKCADLCDQEPACLSYECSPGSGAHSAERDRCFLHRSATAFHAQVKDYQFCMKADPFPCASLAAKMSRANTYEADPDQDGYETAKEHSVKEAWHDTRNLHLPGVSAYPFAKVGGPSKCVYDFCPRIEVTNAGSAYANGIYTQKWTDCDAVVPTFGQVAVMGNRAGGQYGRSYGQEDVVCGSGYVRSVGDVAGDGAIDGVGNLQTVTSCAECAALCGNKKTCLSFECSPSENKCNLNTVKHATHRVHPSFPDYVLCIKGSVDPNTPEEGEKIDYEMWDNACVWGPKGGQCPGGAGSGNADGVVITSQAQCEACYQVLGLFSSSGIEVGSFGALPKGCSARLNYYSAGSIHPGRKIFNTHASGGAGREDITPICAKTASIGFFWDGTTAGGWVIRESSLIRYHDRLERTDPFLLPAAEEWGVVAGSGDSGAAPAPTVRCVGSAVYRDAAPPAGWGLELPPAIKLAPETRCVLAKSTRHVRNLVLSITKIVFSPPPSKFTVTTFLHPFLLILRQFLWEVCNPSNMKKAENVKSGNCATAVKFRRDGADGYCAGSEADLKYKRVFSTLVGSPGECRELCDANPRCGEFFFEGRSVGRMLRLGGSASRR